MIDLLSQYSAVIGLLFFFFVFLTIVFWAFRPTKKQLIESYKYIPLKEESHDLR